jgi:hypothetical protein
MCRRCNRANVGKAQFFVFAIDPSVLPTYVPQQLSDDGNDDGE